MAYSYNYNVPESVVDALDHVLPTFARKMEGTCDLWYHGLPTWFVRGQSDEDERVAQIQIDSVAADNRPILLVRPVPYQDTVTDRDGVRVVSRRTANAGVIREHRHELDISAQVGQSDTTKSLYIQFVDKLWDVLFEVWAEAETLPLEHGHSWTTKESHDAGQAGPMAMGAV